MEWERERDWTMKEKKEKKEKKGGEKNLWNQPPVRGGWGGMGWNGVEWGGVVFITHFSVVTTLEDLKLKFGIGRLWFPGRAPVAEDPQSIPDSGIFQWLPVDLTSDIGGRRTWALEFSFLHSRRWLWISPPPPSLPPSLPPLPPYRRYSITSYWSDSIQPITDQLSINPKRRRWKRGRNSWLAAICARVETPSHRFHGRVMDSNAIESASLVWIVCSAD